MRRWTLLNHLKGHVVLFLSIVGFEVLDFCRPGAIVELDRVLISYFSGAIAMEISRKLIGKPTVEHDSLVNGHHHWATVLGQIGVFSGLVGLYILSCWIGVQKPGYLINHLPC
jgi:hypothetical protein